MNGIEMLEKQMNHYHMIFMVCFIVFLVLLVIDVLIFWRMRIDRVYGYLTGTTARKTIEEMEKGDLESGRLEKGRKKKYASVTKEKNDKKVTVMTPSGQMKMPGTERVMLPAGTGITDILNETELITETVDIKESQQNTDRVENRYGTFRIIKEIEMIHTEEKI